MKTYALRSSDNALDLSVLVYAPVISPIGIVQIAHGMCEHKERYIPFMKFLNERGYVCVINDHRGHGLSINQADELGYFYEGGYKAMVEDLYLITLFIKQEYPNLPLLLFGHSMGSMIVRSYAKLYDDEIAALIVCGSPSYNLGSGIGAFLAKLFSIIRSGKHRSKWIDTIAFGSFQKLYRKEGSKNAWICTDPDVVKAYDANPLCNFTFTNNGFYNLFSLMQNTYSKKSWKLSNPNLPIYFIAGEKDPCILSKKDFLKAVDFMKIVGYKNVSSHLYTAMRHEILNEKGKEQVFEDVCVFLQNK